MIGRAGRCDHSCIPNGSGNAVHRIFSIFLGPDVSQGLGVVPGLDELLGLTGLEHLLMTPGAVPNFYSLRPVDDKSRFVISQ